MFNSSHSPIQNLPTNMKIPISSLLLTIAIFQHFDELNATEPGEGSSTGERRVRGRPKGSLTTRRPGQVLGRPRKRPEGQDQLRDAVPSGELNATEPGEASSPGERRRPGRPRGSVANQHQYRVADPNDGPPHRRVFYGQIEIHVWLDGPSVRKAIFPRNYIPQGPYYSNHNFLIRTLKRGDVTLVAYIGHNEELIGVRPPDSTGHKYDLEPSSSVWYMNYIATHFKVDVVNSAPTAISLMPFNLHTPIDGSCEDTLGGIKFKVFSEYGTNKIDGAQLVSYAFMNE